MALEINRVCIISLSLRTRILIDILRHPNDKRDRLLQAAHYAN